LAKFPVCLWKGDIVGFEWNAALYTYWPFNHLYIPNIGNCKIPIFFPINLNNIFYKPKGGIIAKAIPQIITHLKVKPEHEKSFISSTAYLYEMKRIF
jgi:hypothetical protein